MAHFIAKKALSLLVSSPCLISLGMSVLIFGGISLGQVLFASPATAQVSWSPSSSDDNAPQYLQEKPHANTSRVFHSAETVTHQNISHRVDPFAPIANR